MNAVKAVVVPKAGQSFNPQAEAHQSLLKQVIQREEKDIEERYRGSLQHKQNEAAPVTRMLIERHAEIEAKKLELNKQEESEESEVDSDQSSQEEEEDADKAVGKPVSRAKKLTQAQRNKKLRGKLSQKEQKAAAAERKLKKQYERLDLIIKENSKEAAQLAKAQQEREAEAKKEKALQTRIGEVRKA